jgi:hypothetical protein
MANGADEAALRKLWETEKLREFDGKWIAFRQESIRAASELGPLLEEYAGAIREGTAPIFAFVSFDLRA